MRRGVGLLALGLGVLLGCNSKDAIIGGSGGAGGSDTVGAGGAGAGGAGQGGAGGAPGAVWAQSFGAPGADASPWDLAVDPEGRVLLAGSFSGELDLGGQAPVVSHGGRDIFLVQLDASGAYRWSQRYGGAQADEIGGMALAGTRVVLGGTHGGSPDLGCEPPLPEGNMFVALLDEDGACQWTKGFGDPATSNQVRGVAVDAAGNVLVTGSFLGALDLGGGQLLSSDNLAQDVFVAKLDPAGGHVWSRSYGFDEVQEPTQIAVNKAGQVLIGGEFNGSVGFGGDPLIATGNPDIFVAALTPQADTSLWSTRLMDMSDGTFTSEGYLDALATDDLNNVLLAGRYKGTIRLDNGPSLVSNGRDLFVIKLDASGAPVWLQSFDLPETTLGLGNRFSMAVDPAGDVLIAGHFQGTVQFGSALLTTVETCSPGAPCRDAFLLKLDGESGAPLASRQLGGSGDDAAHAVAVTGAGAPLLAGTYYGSLDFGGVPPLEGGNIFLAMLAAPFTPGP